MKLQYDKETEKRILFPIDLTIKRGVQYETNDKDVIKRLKEIGFHEVKQQKETTKKEGDK